MAKERVVLATKAKKVLKLEADVAELQKTISELRNTQQAKIEGLHSYHQVEVERSCNLHIEEIERKDAFYEAKKVRILLELQVAYIACLSGSV